MLFIKRWLLLIVSCTCILFSQNKENINSSRSVNNVIKKDELIKLLHDMNSKQPYKIPSSPNDTDPYFGWDGNSSCVCDVIFHKDGKTIATTGGDGTIKLWDIKSQSLIRVIFEDTRGYPSYCRIAFSKDYSKIISFRFRDNILNIFDINTGQLLQSIKVGYIQSGSSLLDADDFDYSPNTEQFAVRASSTIQIWDVKSGILVRSFQHAKGGSMAVSRIDGHGSIRFFHNGSILATSGIDGYVKFWDIGSGQNVKNIKCFNVSQEFDDGVVSFCISSDETKLAVIGGTDLPTTIKLIDVNSEKTLWEISKLGPTQISFSPDNSKLALANMCSFELLNTMDGIIIDKICNITRNDLAIFSPDGSKMAVAGLWYSGINIWDLTKSTVEYSIDVSKVGYQSEPRNIAISKDGSKGIAVRGKTILTWNTKSGTLLNTYIANSYVSDACISPNGLKIVYSKEDSFIYIIDLQTNITHNRKLANSMIKGVSFSPDGSKIVAYGKDEKIIISDINNSALKWELSGSNTTSGVRYSPDGSKLISWNNTNNTILIWDISKFELLKTIINDNNIYYIEFMPDGESFIIAEKREEYKSGYKLIDIKSGNLLKNSDCYIPSDSKISPDGKYIAIPHNGEGISEIWVYDLYLGIYKFSVSGGDNQDIYNIAFSPDGTKIYSNSGLNKIIAWKISQEESGLYQWGCHSSEIRYSALSHDGKKLAITDEEETGLTIIWDINTGTIIQVIDQVYMAISYAFSPDDKYLACGKCNGIVQIIDLTNNTIVKTYHVYEDYFVERVAFSSDGKKLAAYGYDDRIRIWDIVSDKLLNTIEGNCQFVNYGLLSFAQNDTLLILQHDMGIHVWNVDSGNLITSFQSESMGIRGLAISPDEQEVAMVGSIVPNYDQYIRFFELKTGKLQNSYKLEFSVGSAAFSPDGNKIAVCSYPFDSSGSIKIIDIWSGNIVKNITFDQGYPLSITFNADGKKIITCGQGYKNIRVYDTNLEMQFPTLNAPVTSRPNEGQHIMLTSSPELFKWTPLLYSVKYNLEIATNIQFSEDLIQKNNLSEASISINELKGNKKYYWRVNASKNGITSAWSNIVGFYTHSTNSVTKNNDFPKVFKAYQNYPNPFNPTTAIHYELPRESFVSIKVYNVYGQEIRTLKDEKQPAGYYEVKFDGSGLSSGVYFYKIDAINFREVRKMVLVK